MKTKYAPGEWAFPAAYNYKGMWEVTGGVFTCREDAEAHFKSLFLDNTAFVWPVEKLDNGGIYIVSPEELYD